MEESKSERLEQMDSEAILARRELELNLNAWRACDVAIWCERWYLKAGHKRLGRILVDLAHKIKTGA